ncbi:probable carboxylesterase 120 [Chenopodium quinoa]|uniref:Alpha/beta hydrolase fold-3 domain-containing protein n=1 Tax=Chenopodium quinoa TaxID=63459 RepID=A0A803M0M2_CHEQI|nr:probable carboxylesterase 120 [Chenopodium quinoa]
MKKLTKLLALLFLITSFVSIQISLSNAQPPLIDPYSFFHIIPNPDGSITRIKEFYPTVPPNTSSTIAFSRDVPLDPVKKTWVRLYLPNKSEHDFNLPIIVFAHGGGFIILSTATPSVDSFLSNTANKLNVLVVSVEYRLAPEHRLPAAYDDVLDALYWVKENKDEWVSNYGDASRCILMGESVGGNIAYNVGLRASVLTRELQPLVIRGLVLIQPFFGGSNPNRVKYGNLQKMIDFLWHLSLPLGANLNNPYFNPMFGGGSRNLDNIKSLGWRIAIAGCDGDFIFDRQVEVFEFFKKQGVNVIRNFGKGFYHGVFIGNSTKAQELYQFVRNVFSPYITW